MGKFLRSHSPRKPATATISPFDDLLVRQPHSVQLIPTRDPIFMDVVWPTWEIMNAKSEAQSTVLSKKPKAKAQSPELGRSEAFQRFFLGPEPNSSSFWQFGNIRS